MTEPALSDQLARERFRTQTGRNFSVIAPAGVGKTRSIVDRICTIAASADARDILPRLVVVTYTNKAADEMRQRARNAILLERQTAQMTAAFNRAFFGTIHSFCMRLLSSYGHFLGLPGELTVPQEFEQARLWARFIRTLDISSLDTGLSEAQLRQLLRYVDIQTLLTLGSRMPPHPIPMPDPSPSAPEPDIAAITRFEGNRKVAKSVAEGRELAARWLEMQRNGSSAIGIPSFSKGGTDFVETWRSTFQLLRNWVTECAIRVGHAISRAYRDYRIREGVVTYDDQIGLVLQLLRDPTAGRILRGLGSRVILDEAQDTDPSQFRVLLEMARPADAEGIWADDGAVPPEHGRFCMVGDPQQSIYGSRSSLLFYENIRKRLLEQGAAEELKFHVTFRCARRIISFANAVAGPMLDGRDGQVSYVSLMPKPDVCEGIVARVELTAPKEGSGGEDEADSGKARVADLRREEAGQIARWLSSRTPAVLGAANGLWSSIAVLCPQWEWLDEIKRAFDMHGVPAVCQSRKVLSLDEPAYAWFTALITVFDDPENSFELAGVLREIFGISDADLYSYVDAGHILSTSVQPTGTSCVARALEQLARARKEFLEKPLPEAAREAVRILCLRQRIQAVSKDPGTSLRILETLIRRASDIENAGGSLSDWARTLRENGLAQIKWPPSNENGVHLLTSHSAKGLEWDVVLLPFLFAAMSKGESTYPLVRPDPISGGVDVVLFPGWNNGENKNSDKGTVQEIQRLAYVSLTRAKKTLILFDDSRLFTGRNFPSIASAAGLVSESVPDAWIDLPAEFPPFPAPEDKPEPRPDSFPRLPDVSQVRPPPPRAKDFPERILPHALASFPADAEPERDRERDEDWEEGRSEHARRYGIWWHRLAENLDWHDRSSWADVYRSRRPECPDPERGDHEWNLFLGSEAAKLLSDPHVTVRAETPFFRVESRQKIIEGLADIAAWNSASEQLIVIDWKTNRISEQKISRLIEGYDPQLKAYADALAAILGATLPPRRFIYSTPLGRLIETGNRNSAP